MGALVIDAGNDEAGVDQVAVWVQAIIAARRTVKARDNVQAVYLLAGLGLKLCQRGQPGVRQADPLDEHVGRRGVQVVIVKVHDLCSSVSRQGIVCAGPDVVPGDDCLPGASLSSHNETTCSGKPRVGGIVKEIDRAVGRSRVHEFEGGAGMFVVPCTGVVDHVAEGIDRAGAGRGQRDPGQDVVKCVPPDTHVAAGAVGLHPVIANAVDRVLVDIGLIRQR